MEPFTVGETRTRRCHALPLVPSAPPRYYEQDLALAKDLQDKLSQAKAYCNLGLAHKALGEHKKAEECQRYLLSLAQALDNTQVDDRFLLCLFLLLLLLLCPAHSRSGR